MYAVPTDPLHELPLREALAALYLPGGPRPFEPPRRGWPEVEHALRLHGVSAESLSREGLAEEALLLRSVPLLAWASRAARRCLTAADDLYPERWLRYLGRSAPPALWLAGIVPPGPYVSVVGSRVIDAPTARFASRVGAVLASRATVVSGGAVGVDRSAVLGAHKASVEILPRGISRSDTRGRGCRLSVRPPGEGFTAAAAMERNTLIWAMSPFTVVVESRLRVGGTWTGATEALRRRLSQPLVRAGGPGEGNAALIALGGLPFDDPKSIFEAMLASPLQSPLAEAG